MRQQQKLQLQQENSLASKDNIPIKKSWGQNFLTDDNTINKIIKIIDIVITIDKKSKSRFDSI